MSHTVRAVAYMAWLNLRALLRDPVMLTLATVVPVLVMVVSGAVFGSSSHVRVGAIWSPTDRIEQQIVGRIDGTQGVQVERYRSRALLQRGLEDGSIGAGIVFPSSVERSLASGQGISIDFITARSALYPIQLRAEVDGIVARQTNLYTSARFVSVAAGVPMSTAVETTSSLLGLTQSTVRERGAGSFGSAIHGYSFSAPASLILFIFVTTVASAGAMVSGRMYGVTSRLRTTPTSPAVITAGEYLGRVLIAGMQAAIVVVVGRLLFSVQWGPPLLTLAVIGAYILGVCGLAIVLGVLARTLEQVVAIAPASGVLLGMLGGCIWPLSYVSGPLRRIGHLTPQAWAIDALTKIDGRGGATGDVLTEILVLLGFAVLLVSAALLTVRVSRVRAAG